MDEGGRCGRNKGYLVCLCDACEEDVDKAVTGMALSITGFSGSAPIPASLPSTK